MSRNKQQKFLKNAQNPKIIEQGKPVFETIRENWEIFFGNTHPIILEIGCGKGEYTLGLAENCPNQNYIGIDKKGYRIFEGATVAEQNQVKNAAFLRTDVVFLEKFFLSESISEIWLTFPDPRVKDSEQKHRLTHPRFLKLFHKLLQPNGILHLKTDSFSLMEFTRSVLEKSGFILQTFAQDLYQNLAILEEHKGLQTTFEKKFLAQNTPILYLNAKKVEDFKKNPHF